MKLYALMAVAALTLSGANSFSEEKKPAPATQPVNKMCPVDTELEIDADVTIVHEGKTIAFCCEDCIPEFKKDPEKYTKNMK